MKTIFDKDYLLKNMKHYKREEILSMSFLDKEQVDIFDILDSELFIKYKIWFLFEKCELTIEQKQFLLLKLARMRLVFLEAVFPRLSNARKCLDAIDRVQKGTMNAKKLASYINYKDRYFDRFDNFVCAIAESFFAPSTESTYNCLTIAAYLASCGTYYDKCNASFNCPVIKSKEDFLEAIKTTIKEDFFINQN